MFATLFTGARPFDLQATLDSWATAPEFAISEFKGKPKRKDDPTAEAWLDLVEKGCSGRRVPRTHWPDVAKHFMVKKARARVVEVEKVMCALHGEQWTWTWKHFRIAFLSMGWNIDERKTREINVERKATGLWKIVTGQKDDSANSTTTTDPTSSKKGSGSKLATPSPKKAPVSDGKSNKLPEGKPSKLLGSAPKPAVLPKANEKSKASDDKEKKEKEKEKEKEKKDARTMPARSGSLFSLPALPFLRPAPQPEQPLLTRITAQVPLWLLAATETLAVLANENPDVLTAIATGLVAVGTMSTGGSAAIAAVGEAAVMVGRALKGAHDRVHQGRGHAH
ncbi:hypothetical protein C8Q74DRAFT_1320177 [Fomes fomentarius]|nr:hypothetical protein C8Q74DRAFT_1320177 [Fomes fomentarius]